jgi:YcxB-like protein
MPIEFEFPATPELANKALRYLLWRRGGPLGPIAIILLPVVIAVMAADPAMRPVAYIAGGAAIMLFVIFLLAVAHRRKIRRRFFQSTTDHTVRVSIDDEGIAVKSAAGNSTLPWSIMGRIWAGKEVVLVFYHGWHYLAFPTASVPANTIEFISAKIQDGCSRRR